MKLLIKIAAIAVTASLITGCTNESGEVSKQGLVGLTGAVAGGVIGSNVGKGSGRTAAIIGGTVLGGLLGSEVGKSLDRADLAYHQRTQAQALEYNRVGTTSSWKNPDTGASGSITPIRTYDSGGRYCREYNQNIQVGGKTQRGHGTACRNPDGTWEIVR
jgi:surface antigen